MTVQVTSSAFIPRSSFGPARPAPARERATLFDLLALALFLWHASAAEQFLFTQGGPAPILFQATSLAILAGVVAGRILARARVAPGGVLFGFCVVVVITVAWNVINFLYGSMSERAVDLLRSHVIAAVFMVLFAHLLSGERTARAFSIGCAALACLGAFLNMYDLATGAFSTTAGRAAGFYMNPNVAGFMIPCLGIFAMRSLSAFWRNLVWAIVVVGTIITFSRAAYLFLIVGTLGLSWLGYLGWRSQRFLFAAILVPLVAAFVYALSTGLLYELVAASPLAGHLNENAIQRLGGAGMSVLENESTTERAGVAAMAFELFLSSPLVGHGFASTFEWALGQSTHNIYLLSMAEGGLVGLIVYLTLIGYLSLRARGIAVLVAAIVLLQGLFNHNILDDLQQALVIAGLAAIGAGARRVYTEP
jgi:O-antigen ligase